MTMSLLHAGGVTVASTNALVTTWSKDYAFS
jgi:hypothetical protein